MPKVIQFTNGDFTLSPDTSGKCFELDFGDSDTYAYLNLEEVYGLYELLKEFVDHQQKETKP